MEETKPDSKTTEAKKAEAGKYVCPECGKVFDRSQSRGSHRRIAHGYKAPTQNTVSKKIKDGNPVYTCPECKQTFDRPTSLGIHRRHKHGVLGAAKSTVEYREHQAREVAKATAPVAATKTFDNGKVIFVCPECKKEFSNENGLRIHRSVNHGVKGTSYSAQHNQNVASGSGNVNMPYVCPECGKEYKFPTALGIHRHNAHGVMGTSASTVAHRDRENESRSHHPQKSNRGEIVYVNQSPSPANQPPSIVEGIPDVALGYTFGKCESLIAIYAENNGIAKGELTRRVAELLLRSTHR